MKVLHGYLAKKGKPANYAASRGAVLLWPDARLLASVLFKYKRAILVFDVVAQYVLAHRAQLRRIIRA
jgi:hypothetical protein